MSDNKFVAMGQRQCEICTTIEESGEILINKRLKTIPEDNRFLGAGTCKKCSELKEEYIALVGVNKNKSTIINGNLKQENAYRTGSVLHVKRNVIHEIIPDIDKTSLFVFVDEELIKLLTPPEHILEA